MDRRRRGFRVLSTVVVLGGLVLGACSGGDGESSSGSTTSTSAGGDPITTTTSIETEGGGDGCQGETPVWVLKSTEDPIQADDEDGQEREDPSAPTTDDTSTDTTSEGGEECEEGPVLGTGELQITLRWEGNADYDLHVVEPDGTEISYTDPGPTESGGELDVDSNIGCVDNGGVENVFWPDNQMPDGHYTVTVVGYSVDGCEGGEYELVVNVRGEEILRETGTVDQDEEVEYEFDTE